MIYPYLDMESLMTDNSEISDLPDRTILLRR